MIRQTDQLGICRRHQHGQTMLPYLQSGGESGNIKQPDIMRNDITPAIGICPAPRCGDTGFPCRKESIRLGPKTFPLFRQRHGTHEPRTGTRVVIALPHFNRFQLPVRTPGQPEGLLAPSLRMTDAINPTAIILLQEQDFLPGLTCKNDGRNLFMILNDRKEELIETQQLIVFQRAIPAPLITGIECRLHRRQQPLHARLNLGDALVKLGLSNILNRRHDDETIGAEGKQQQGGQHNQESLQHQAFSYAQTG